jgi:hypothetical protein
MEPKNPGAIVFFCATGRPLTKPVGNRMFAGESTPE